MQQIENYLNNVLSSLICIIHIIIIILILYIPIFSNSNYFLFACLVLLPFIELHWIFNNNICCLTEIEKKIRGVDDNESFINKILSPIYQFPHNKDNNYIYYFIMNILISIVISKMIYKYNNNEIKGFWDLYII